MPRNVMFMALSADTQPRFTTIAAFIAELGDEARQIFRDVLLVCDEEGLTGREMFGVDGVKLPSNASKEWSGTRAEFERKVKKMERAVDVLGASTGKQTADRAKARAWISSIGSWEGLVAKNFEDCQSFEAMHDKAMQRPGVTARR